MPKNQETKPQTEKQLKQAPMPGGNFVKVPIGTVIEGTITAARMEMQEVRGKKAKGQTKERYHFDIALAHDAKLLVGKKKNEKEKEFKRGEIVTLPDHGYLTSVFRRTACEIAGVPFNDEADTDLKPLEGVYFRIERLEDGEITSGQFSGTASALYDVRYEAKELVTA